LCDIGVIIKIRTPIFIPVAEVNVTGGRYANNHAGDGLLIRIRCQFHLKRRVVKGDRAKRDRSLRRYKKVLKSNPIAARTAVREVDS
jgi:hypothetical protein